MDAKVKAICGMLRSEDPLRRLAAAIVLGELAPRDATVVKALGDALADANQSLTGAILDAFDAIGSPAALPFLLPLIDAEELAAGALAHHPKAAAALLEALLGPPMRLRPGS